MFQVPEVTATASIDAYPGIPDKRGSPGRRADRVELASELMTARIRPQSEQHAGERIDAVQVTVSSTVYEMQPRDLERNQDTPGVEKF